METNEQNISNSISFDNRSAFNQSLRKNVCSDYFFTPSEILENSKNFILILSNEGKPQKISWSFYSALGYANDELINSSTNKLLILGEFALNNNSSSYYFDSVIKCKGGINKKITWRLIPNLLINEFVYIGWQL